MADVGATPPEDHALDPRRAPRPLEDSLLRSGLIGIGAVALATLALVIAGAVIALAVSAVF